MLWQPHSMGVKWKLQVSTCSRQSCFGAVTTFQGGIGCQGGEIWASEMVQAWFFQYWPTLELARPNILGLKFAHACQDSYKPSTIPVGLVVWAQELI